MNKHLINNNSGISLIQVLMAAVLLAVGVTGLNTQMKNMSESGTRIKKKIGILKTIRSISEVINREENCNAFITANDVENISVGNNKVISSLVVNGETLLEKKNYNDKGYIVSGIEIAKLNSEHIEIQVRTSGASEDIKRDGAGKKELVDVINIYLKKDVNDNTLCQNVEGAVSDAILAKVCTGPGAYILNGRCMKVGLGQTSGLHCPLGTVVRKSKYDSRSGIYESYCQPVKGRDIKEFMLENPVGEYCSVRDLTVSNTLGRVFLKCSSGNTNHNSNECSENGDACGSGCCGSLICNSLTNTCSTSIPVASSAEICCHNSESMQHNSANGLQGLGCATDVGLEFKCWIHCKNTITQNSVNMEECGETQQSPYAYKKKVTCESTMSTPLCVE